MALDHVQSLSFTDPVVSTTPLSFDSAVVLKLLSFDSVVPLKPQSHDSAASLGI
jgi:hypothetical protein